MANTITLNSPGRPEYLGHFIDSFVKNRQDEEDRTFREKQLAQQGQYQQGMLANDTARTAGDTSRNASLVGTEDLNQQILKGKLVLEEVQRLKEAGDITGARKVISDALAKDPGLGKINLSVMLSGGTTNTDRANANASQFDAAQTGIAAGGGTDPNAVNYTTRRNLKADMPGFAFAQQQANDLQARGGGSADKIPKPTGNAVTDFERRATEAMPTSAQNQTAQTQITTEGMREAGANTRATIAASSNRTAQAKTEGESIAQAIIDGKQPPVVTSRTLEGPVRAALAAQDYDLTKATQDWKATEKYLSTLNGAGQVRLRQAVDFAGESLGVVKDLAGQWKAGGFPILNAARMAAAKQGALGPQAQEIATKLESQIVEMQAELAVVYRGGNSPTDEAMKQAAKVLQANWSEKTLLANVGLLETNLQIRRNSIVSAGVASNPNNSYAPNVTLPPPAGTGNAAPNTNVVGTYVPGKGLVRH